MLIQNRRVGLRKGFYSTNRKTKDRGRFSKTEDGSLSSRNVNPSSKNQRFFPPSHEGAFRKTGGSVTLPYNAYSVGDRFLSRGTMWASSPTNSTAKTENRQSVRTAGFGLFFHFLLLQLNGIELIVSALLVEQFLVVALLDDLALGQKDNVVRVLNGT